MQHVESSWKDRREREEVLFQQNLMDEHDLLLQKEVEQKNNVEHQLTIVNNKLQKLQKDKKNEIEILTEQHSKTLNDQKVEFNKWQSNQKQEYNLKHQEMLQTEQALTEKHEKELFKQLQNQKDIQKTTHLNNINQLKKLHEESVTRTYKSDAVSNVAVIIVKLIFISAFLFYCLLCNHSFPTNPNSVTNCFKLILSITTLQTTFAQCVRLFLIFEQVH